MTSISRQQQDNAVSATHPRCPVCVVPMWLVKIQRHDSGDPKLTRNHYECKTCDARAILPPMGD
jgi:hypothetical protein